MAQEGFDKDLAEALSGCLEAVEAGESTLEDCLRQHPEHAAKLKPLMMAAEALRGSLRPELTEQQVNALQARLTTQLMGKPEELEFDMSRDVKKYLRLPDREASGEGESTWRLVLVSSDAAQAPLGIELHDDIIIGRPSPDFTIDLDLTEFRGGSLGVSRLHALLQPSDDGLIVYDLASTNGTSLNSMKLASGVPHRVNSGDVLSFSKVHFKLKVVESPSKAS